MRSVLLLLAFLWIPLVSSAQKGDSTTTAWSEKVRVDTVYIFTKAQRDSIQRLVIQDKTYGDFTPGNGFEIAHGSKGSVNFSVYALMRYINQEPNSKTFKDHLGRERTLDPRKDIQWHRSLLYFNGWAFNPKFTWSVNTWSVISTGQILIIGSLTYRFDKHFSLSGGLNALPTTRSLQGSHPLWQANDRAMADEYFRAGFSSSIWAKGEVIPKLYYTVTIANNLSQLGLNATQLTRDLAKGGSLLWMPTTGEFGPRGAYGDWEHHEKLATRFGGGYGWSREDRFNQDLSANSSNTQIKISDSQNLFDTNALSDSATVQQARWQQFAIDAGLKYHGLFMHVEYFQRLLDQFETVEDKPVPDTEINENGYMIQVSGFPIKQKLELYGFHSYINGKWNKSSEIGGGLNFYPFDTRYFRINGHVMSVDKAAPNSVFGFYLGGMTGMTYSIGVSFIL